MSLLKVSVQQQDRMVFSRMREIPSKLRAGAFDLLRDYGFRTAAQAKINLREQLMKRSHGGRTGVTGRTIQSIRAVVDRPKRRVEIGPSAPAGYWIEVGRRPGSKPPPLAAIEFFVLRKPVKVDLAKERKRAEDLWLTRLAHRIAIRRGYGRPPPYPALRAWAKAKGLLGGRIFQAPFLRRVVAWRIARAIGRKGILPAPYLVPAYDQYAPGLFQDLDRFVRDSLAAAAAKT